MRDVRECAMFSTTACITAKFVFIQVQYQKAFSFGDADE